MLNQSSLPRTKCEFKAPTGASEEQFQMLAQRIDDLHLRR